MALRAATEILKALPSTALTTAAEAELNGAGRAPGAALGGAPDQAFMSAQALSASDAGKLTVKCQCSYTSFVAKKHPRWPDAQHMLTG